MDDLIIRDSIESDFPFIYNLICQLVGSESLSEETLQEIYLNNLSNKNKHLLVALLNEKVIGFISLTIDLCLSEVGKILLINELIVNNEYRNQGIGKQLLKSAIEIAKSNECLLIELSTSLKREEAHKFYQKNSFVKNGYRFSLTILD